MSVGVAEGCGAIVLAGNLVHEMVRSGRAASSGRVHEFVSRDIPELPNDVNCATAAFVFDQCPPRLSCQGGAVRSRYVPIGCLGGSRPAYGLC